MDAIKELVNRRFRGDEPWKVALKTLVAAGAVYGVTNLVADIKERGVGEVALDIARKVPIVKGIIDKELEKSKADVKKMTLADPEVLKYPVNAELPARGKSKEDLLRDLVVWKRFEKSKYENGQVSGTVYHGEEDLADFLGNVYRLFCITNPLHPSTFPFVQKMEAEVIAMTLRLFQGLTDEHCGVTTSGGTESIIMAMKSYKEFGAKERGITKPEIVACVTAHAAFDKAADYFSMKLVHVPADAKTCRLDFERAKAAITANTVVVVCSAPSYPQGVIDGIEEMAAHLRKLKQTRGWDIGLHVDSCLGGFLAPFVRLMPEYKMPKFDFSVPGVTSISADTHKYGYSPKGTSVLMYANRNLRRYQYFTAPKWTGGIYATPSVAGSRSGGVIAATWAVMMHMGMEGYMQASRAIMRTSRAIQEGIRGIDGLEVMSNPELSVVGIRSTDPNLNIYAVSAAMGHDGGKQWELNALQNPACIHICCTYAHRDKAKQFVDDLKAAVKDVRENKQAYAKKSSVAIYGTTEVVPGSLTAEMSKIFIDSLFALPEGKAKADAEAKQ